MGRIPLTRASHDGAAGHPSAVGLLLVSCDSAPTGPAPVAAGPVAFPIAFIGWDPTVSSSSDRIYLVNPDGMNLHVLPFDPSHRSFGQLSWAPDRSRLAVSGNGVIYVLDTAGTSLTRLPTGSGFDSETRESVSDGEPAWSPDGTRIAFTRGRVAYREENANDLSPAVWTRQVCTARADGSDVACLTGLPGRAGSPAWSPDGHRLAFAAGDSTVPTAPSPVVCPSMLYVADADGTNAHAITTLPPEASCGTWYQGDSSPEWSPDGRRIVFVSDRERGSNRTPGFGHIYVVDADGSKFQQLTHTPPGFETPYDASPTWSPDGTRIAYAHQAYTAFVNGRASADSTHGLHVMKADGPGSTRIVADLFVDGGVAWRAGP